MGISSALQTLRTIVIIASELSSELVRLVKWGLRHAALAFLYYLLGGLLVGVSEAGLFHQSVVEFGDIRIGNFAFGFNEGLGESFAVHFLET